MELLAALIIVAALLIGFLLLTSLEKRRGVREAAPVRSVLDEKVRGAVSYLASSSTHASLTQTVRTTVDHVAHEVVHKGLLVVRFVERTLTRLAREIRGRRAKQTNGEPPTTSVE